MAFPLEACGMAAGPSKSVCSGKKAIEDRGVDGRRWLRPRRPARSPSHAARDIELFSSRGPSPVGYLSVHPEP